MAYNPFDFFRKNQKIFFAGLTIVVMFMFVLSFGQGDFFQWFPRWLGSMRSEGTVLAEVNGSKVRESDISRLQKGRVLANQFMSQVADQQFRVVAQKVRANELNVDKISSEARLAIQQAESPVKQLEQMANFRQQLGGGIGEEFFEQLRVAYLQSQSLLSGVITRPGLKAEDKEAAEAARKLAQARLSQMDRAQAAGRRESSVYFANMPNRSEKDRLEFLLWLKKADQLGIRYTTEDVKRLIELEAPDVSADDITKLSNEVTWDRRQQGEDALWNALADEFRVRAAQTAVLGPDEIRHSGGYPTPTALDLFEYYKKEASPTNYAFLTVPVEPFMAQVLGEPTEAELKQIFRDYRSTPPDPSNPKSGIQEPRRIKVEWVEITGKEPYYDAPAAARLAAVSGARALFGPAAADDKFKTASYDQYKQTQNEIARLWAGPLSNPGMPRLTEPFGAILGGMPVGEPVNMAREFKFGAVYADKQAKLADASIAKPHNVGVLAGLLGGAFATGGSLMTAPVVMTETGYTVEKEQRLLAGIQAFHFPTLPGLPVMSELTGADMAVLSGLPQALPQPLVQPILDDISMTSLRFSVALDDVKEFEKKLIEIMKKDDKTAAQKEAAEYVAKFIKDRGLKTDAAKALRDMHTIADEPALAPLITKSGQTDPILGTLSNPVRKSSFGATLFLRAKPPRSEQEVRQPQFEQAIGLYDPNPYPPTRNNEFTLGDATPLTLVWRTEETKTETPREYNDPQVIERCKLVWKRLKARELARKECEKVLAELKLAGESGPVLNKKLLDAEASLKALFPGTAGVRIIPEYKYSVAKLVKDKSPLASGEPTLRPFSLQPGTDDFVYPTAKMIDELLANRDKPVGTTVVLADAPESTLYVAVVMSKDQADPLTFRETVVRKMGQSNFSILPTARDVVTARQAVEARKDARAEAVALLKAEFGYANENPDLDKRTSDIGE